MDGDVDFADFLILQNHFGNMADSLAGANVAVTIPEPSTLALTVCACGALILYTRCARRRV